MSRREFLVGSGATALLTALPGFVARAAAEPLPIRHFSLRPGKARAQLVPGELPGDPRVGLQPERTGSRDSPHPG